MASIWKQSHSQYWTACFRDGNGKQRRITTKETNRRRAQQIANEFEKTARSKRTFLAIQRTLEELHKEFCPEDSIQKRSLRAFCETWLGSKESEVGLSTLAFYSCVVSKLISFFAERADRPISLITRDDLIGFRDSQSGKVSPTTINHDLIAVKMIFKHARRDKVLAEDPAEFVENVRLAPSLSKRRAFTVPELLALLAVCDPEWQSMVRVGLYTGQRLSDVASLRWNNVNFERGEIRLVTQKTARRICVPITGALRDHLLSLPSSDDPNGWLHPRAASRLSPTTRSARLSQEFAKLLQLAGLREAGRTQGRRTSHPLSFHSLRHTAVSLLKDAGIPQAVVQELIGHSSAELSALYTHVGREALERAAATLPAL